MSAFDRDPALVLADHWQRDFPLLPRPFAKAGKAFDLTEAETIRALERLANRQLLSRIGPVVRPNTAGASTLCALAISKKDLPRIAQAVSAERYVNHNYERDHQFNLWFVVAAPTVGERAACLDRIAAFAGQQPLDLRLLKSFHIDLGFSLRGGARRELRSSETFRTATPDEIRLIAALEDGLPLAPRPYRDVGTRLSTREHSVIATLGRLVSDGVVSRFGCVLRHREIGFTANAMACWDVPDDRVEALGRAVTLEPQVTLCYRRNRSLPEWPYNLFVMVHGRDMATVREVILGIGGRTGLLGMPHDVLFSRRCFKQRGARFLTGRAATEQAA
ncbi:MAG: hypothetical protein U1E46_13720 [Hyphomicrobiales bacterium]